MSFQHFRYQVVFFKIIGFDIQNVELNDWMTECWNLHCVGKGVKDDQGTDRGTLYFLHVPHQESLRCDMFSAGFRKINIYIYVYQHIHNLYLSPTQQQQQMKVLLKILYIYIILVVTGILGGVDPIYAVICGAIPGNFMIHVNQGAVGSTCLDLSCLTSPKKCPYKYLVNLKVT